MDFSKTSPNCCDTSSALAHPATIAGTEWLIDVAGCDEHLLRDLNALKELFRRVVTDLNLQIIGETRWHKFPMPGGGITGFAMLTESHLACHTYPEYGAATINLYCCRARPHWPWEENLIELLGARSVCVRRIERGETTEERFEISNLKSSIVVPASQEDSHDGGAAQ
jgi:S-adenosylmethionine decarboxylase